jgi:hypothetical protein
MIILTRELVELRIQAREMYPDAEWLPGDEPPAGLVVLRSDGASATVLGQAYKQKNNLTYWWCLRDERYPGYEVLDWPPSLHRIKEK